MKQMKWQVVDLTNFDGSVSAKTGWLHVGEDKLPLANVGSILIGPDCSWGHGVAHHAAEHDCSVVLCDWRGVPIATVLPFSENSRVGARHRAQAQLSIPRQKNAWARIVKAKVLGQSRVLDHIGSMASARLETLSRLVRSGDPTNVEAQAAQIYWKSLFGDSSYRRIPGARDFHNAVLNYGYTILRGRVIQSIVAAGLSPSLGVFHRHRANVFALADDLIEPFRPAVDALAVRIVNEGAESLDSETKRALVGVLETCWSRKGESLATAVLNLTQRYASYVEGEKDKLRVGAYLEAGK
ncbi:type II CRISPR-associated endonuclease Cas1 [Micrococcoides hystricis]|uniref:CRISPR-associated endonuclease Cas1 n=1 Tax=Micrococcoides hystricis TaxID=1572761 RepID=A0ABV6PAM6_9MICC